MILDMIQEWFKELLIDGIISNLTGMFDTLNTKVGEIAGEVGMTPAAWNSSIFNMIRNLSETVIVPIAIYFKPLLDHDIKYTSASCFFEQFLRFVLYAKMNRGDDYDIQNFNS